MRKIPTVVFLGGESSGKSTICGLIIKNVSAASQDEITEAIQAANDNISNNIKENITENITENNTENIVNEDLFRLGINSLRWIIDTCKKSRSIGHTIDYSFKPIIFGTQEFVIIDTPGKCDYIKNTISSITLADCAVLVVSARKNEFDISINNGSIINQLLLAYSLGISDIIILVSKMDEPCTPNESFSLSLFQYIVQVITNILEELDFPSSRQTEYLVDENKKDKGCVGGGGKYVFIPVSAYYDVNITHTHVRAMGAVVGVF
eukprot:GHVR01178841.1.p1 GENE.GHVR01178841.1~~GHVR01178841.1.p1  ORF type:complete len:264 (-),score=80.17 GHVR01178841.1:18-809(-)